MSESDKKPTRRDFILTATTAAGAVGVGAAVWPLVDQMNPDASVKALASTEVDISGVQPGQAITVLWRGKPVFIKRRTSEEIERARNVDLKELKHPEKDEDRAQNPEWLVTLGICTHLGCVPLTNKGDYEEDGFVLVMDLIMMSREELEVDPHQQILRFHNIHLLIVTLLKLDKNYERTRIHT